MVLGIVAGLVVVCAIAILGATGFAILGVAWIVASGESADEPKRDDEGDLAGRIGSALGSMLEMPYSRSSAHM